MNWIDKLKQKARREWERLLRRIVGIEESPNPPTQPDSTAGGATLPAVGSPSWRTDLATVAAVNGVVAFRTRGVKRPTGANQDGGAEYIIARATGDGFTRVLLMTMAGNRPPSRIHWQTPQTEAHTNANVFDVPIAREASWRIIGTGGPITIELDGREIWRLAGSYTVRGAIMNGYPKRHFLGEWAT